MAVGSAEVRRATQFGVVDETVKGVDCDDGAVVSCCAESSTGRVHGFDDLGGRSLATVDELVADADGIENGPVAVGGLDDGLETGGEVLEIVDTGKDTETTLAGGIHNRLGLVTVDAVDADERVALELIKVVVDLLLVATLAVRAIGRV